MTVDGAYHKDSLVRVQKITVFSYSGTSLPPFHPKTRGTALERAKEGFKSQVLGKMGMKLSSRHGWANELRNSQQL